MLKERHLHGQLSWSTGARVAVALTFDFQGSEDVSPIPNSGKGLLILATLPD